ncbi:MAG: hypothetical protein EP348_10145 [Alphaproteobacteria bacterium]|nr:MAG: hypothetical protein EP348_10145 [Alphaproteobacteria bacterium]
MMKMTAAPTGKVLTGKHVLLILCAFFGVMFAVNGAFVYFALGSFSGLSDDAPYNHGIHYNQEFAHHQRMEARQWQPVLKFVETNDHRAGELVLSLKDADGNLLTELDVNATLRRPVVAKNDMTLHFKYDGEKYKADIPLDGKGQWDAVVLVNGGGYDEPYRLDKRIWVK